MSCRVCPIEGKILLSLHGYTPVQLISESYHKDMAKHLADEIKLVNEKRFIFNVSKVKELFTSCLERKCNATMEYVQESFVGCAIKIIWQCINGHCGTWHSSEILKKVYVNNILVAASLLFSGNNITKFSLFAKCLELGFFSKSSFQKYQKHYLIQQIHSFWTDMQKEMFKNLENKSGDGQMDSPGHSAKNCIHTVMEVDSNYILHVEVVDVRHSQLKSACMEKVGCQRALDFLMPRVQINELITDASSQIIKMLGNKISCDSNFILLPHTHFIYLRYCIYCIIISH